MVQTHRFCSGSTSVGLTYSATTGSPDRYTLDFDAAAVAQGFADITNAALPASPISITVPAAALKATYNATIIVKNGTCTSEAYNISISIVGDTNGGVIAAPEVTVCRGKNLDPFTSTTDASGGGNTFTYTWQKSEAIAPVAGDGSWTDILASNSTTFDYGTLDTTTWFIRKAVDGTCTTPVYSNMIKVTVRPILKGGSVGTDQEICRGANVNAFTSTTNASGGDNTFTYTWQKSEALAPVAGDGSWTDILASNSTTFDYGTLDTTTWFIRKAVDGTCTTPVYSNMIK
ncbi:MAG: hypothetical protein HC905_24055, partial [Bacteroidales bacterium]|nr:hypothetical protein [Bacteroidales bacterium]